MPGLAVPVGSPSAGSPLSADGERARHVVLFQSSWPLQSHSLSLAEELRASGYEVTLCLHDVDMGDVGWHGDISDGITIRTWALREVHSQQQTTSERDTGNSAVRRGMALANRLLSGALRRARGVREGALLLLGSPRGLVPAAALRESTELVAVAGDCVLIGVEKAGLVWAGQVASKTNNALVYYSLELYTRDYPFIKWNYRWRRLKRAEEHFHRIADATIVQDEARARVLLADNGVVETRVAYLPVSLQGPAQASHSNRLHRSLGLSTDTPIVLQLGLIWEHRLSVDLAAAAQGFPEGWMLVMHGYGEQSCIDAVRRADTQHRALLSLAMVPYGDLAQLVASARVGLVLYAAWPENDRLTARSSEKLAMFLRAGVPVIAFNYPGYEILSSYDCGVLIGNLDELPAALEAVEARREEMSVNACVCFSEEYDFTRTVRPSLAVVAELAGRRGRDATHAQ